MVVIFKSMQKFKIALNRIAYQYLKMLSTCVLHKCFNAEWRYSC